LGAKGHAFCATAPQAWLVAQAPLNTLRCSPLPLVYRQVAEEISNDYFLRIDQVPAYDPRQETAAADK